jgi:diguanylate cyclase (GGDEF)-like protein
MDLALGVLSAYVGLYHLVLYFNNKKESEKKHFALMCFGIALNDFAGVGLYGATTAAAGSFWQNGQFFCATAISTAFVMFTFRLVKKKVPFIGRIFLATLALIFASGIVLNRFVLDAEPLTRSLSAFGLRVTFYEHKPGVIWNALYAFQLAGMVYLSMILLRECIQRKKRDLLPFIFGFIVFFVSVVIDILISANAILFVYTVEYSFMVMILAMDYILKKRFLDLFAEVETLNLNLEKKVQERTVEIKRIADELSAVNAELENSNRTLFALAERDGMTKLYNHAAFHRHLAEYFNLSKRHAFPISVMLLDIDYFKRINDTYGHQAGDRVIVVVSDILNSNYQIYDIKAIIKHENAELRIYDFSGRYGGDEFAVALPYCGLKEAGIVVDRICEKIRGFVFPEMPDLRVTVSVGCAVLQSHDSCENEFDLMELADQALYKAKENGRNRSEILSV